MLNVKSKKTKGPIASNKKISSAVVLGVFLLTLFCLSSSSASASINKTINYQGKINTRSTGISLSDGTYDMRFRIYDALTDGNLLWTGTHTAANSNPVAITNGIFSVLLGSGTGNTLSLDFSNNSYYLEVSIYNSDTTSWEDFSPRKQIASVPQAYNANSIIGDGNISLNNTSVSQSAAVITYNPASGTNNALEITYGSGGGSGTALRVTQSGDGDILRLYDDSNQVFTVLDGGNVGIGVTSPDAYLEITGGTTAKPSLILGSGSLLSSPISGAIENDGNYLYYTDSSDNRQILNTGSLVKEPTGFPNRTDTTLSFTNSSPDRTFTITGTNFEVYSKGSEYTKDTESIQIANTTGIHYIYYDKSTMSLSESTSPWSLTDGTIQIATVYWNGSTGLIGDERHGIIMDGATHSFIHGTIGTRYHSGLTGTFNSTDFTLVAGSIDDEDININISQQTQARVFYRTSESGKFTYTSAQTKFFSESSDVIQYDDGDGTPADVTTGSYVAYWVFATNDSTTPIYSLMGQRIDTKLTDAMSLNKYESLDLGTLPFAEMKLLYRVIIRRNGTSEVISDTQDLRSVSNLPAGTYVASAHGLLTGLTSDDHTQYGLLGGRSGGQTFYGGNEANNIFTISGNNATSGNTATNANLRFNVGDSAATTAMTILNNGNVGIGVASPGQALDVSGSIRSDAQLISTVATGTAPLSVASTTAVTNLNADLLDGNEATAFATSSHTHSNLTQGNGITSFTYNGSSAQTIALGALTANWSQTGAYDIVLGNGTFDNTSAYADLYATGNIEADGTIFGTFSGSGASLTSIPESSISDGSLLARVAGSESISGVWEFTAEPLLSGTGRHVRQMKISPEYTGAVLTAFYGLGTDTSINGTMTSDTEPSADELRTYYEWTSSQSSLNYYTVAIRVALPSDFSSWTTSDAVQVDFDTESTSTSDNIVSVYIYNGDDTPGTAVASSTSNVSSTADTWTSVSIDDSAIDDASAPEWDAPGETAVIYLRMGSLSDNFVRIGDIKLNYLSKW